MLPVPLAGQLVAQRLEMPGVARKDLLDVAVLTTLWRSAGMLGCKEGRMNKLVYRAWAKAIVSLVVAMAMLMLGHGYPLAKWGGAIFLALSFLHVLEAWGHKR